MKIKTIPGGAVRYHISRMKELAERQPVNDRWLQELHSEAAYALLAMERLRQKPIQTQTPRKAKARAVKKVPMAKRKVLPANRKKGDEARAILTATKLNATELRKVQRLAYAYTKNGDVSTWVRHAILKWRPTEEDLVTIDPPKKP